MKNEDSPVKAALRKRFMEAGHRAEPASYVLNLHFGSTLWPVGFVQPFEEGLQGGLRLALYQGFGHKDSSTTLDVYAHTLPDQQREAAAKVAALLHG